MIYSFKFYYVSVYGILLSKVMSTCLHTVGVVSIHLQQQKGQVRLICC